MIRYTGLLLSTLPALALAAVGRGSTGLQQMMVVGAVVFLLSTAIAIWQVKRRNIAERPVRILVFAAWFWICVFALTLAFALGNAWLAS